MSQDFKISDELVKELLKNQTSARRWRNFKFVVLMLFMFFLVWSIFSGLREVEKPVATNGKDKGYVALIRLNGYIFPGSDFSAKTVIPLLNDAFKDKDAKGVVLDINSGGGSPVQSSIIYDKIVELKKKYNKKVVIVGEDLLASGAYMVAMGGDKIYVNPNTIAGSIGVVMEGFGFSDAIDKIGVKRRVFTAGTNKHRLDAFEPLTKSDVEKAHQVLDETHAYFINVVKTSRGKRLNGDDKELFSGDFWTGMTAQKLGIVDGLGNLSQVIPKEFGVDQYVDYSQQQPFLKEILRGVGTELNMNWQTYSGTHLESVLTG